MEEPDRPNLTRRCELLALGAFTGVLDRLLSETHPPRINVSEETESFTTYVVALAKGIEDPRVVNDITRDWSVSGIVAFTVQLFGASCVTCGDFRVVDSVLNVTCPDIKVGFSDRSSSHGTMVVQHSPNITGIKKLLIVVQHGWIIILSTVACIEFMNDSGDEDKKTENFK
ncbi:hypothetical protein V6N13_067168 [Hibiscus sabdariffa]|uniref:Uncharacterized protein n=1 Tax=Hibiscus sabdariffa TaxID=183260 RepID=A0ABR2DSM1_9ROSI